jgi:hypothetical protein
MEFWHWAILIIVVLVLIYWWNSESFTPGLNLAEKTPEYYRGKNTNLAHPIGGLY